MKIHKQAYHLPQLLIETMAEKIIKKWKKRTEKVYPEGWGWGPVGS